MDLVKLLLLLLFLLLLDRVTEQVVTRIATHTPMEDIMVICVCIYLYIYIYKGHRNRQQKINLPPFQWLPPGIDNFREDWISHLRKLVDRSDYLFIIFFFGLIIIRLGRGNSSSTLFIFKHFIFLKGGIFDVDVVVAVVDVAVAVCLLLFFVEEGERGRGRSTEIERIRFHRHRREKKGWLRRLPYGPMRFPFFSVPSLFFFFFFFFIFKIFFVCVCYFFYDIDST